MAARITAGVGVVAGAVAAGLLPGLVSVPVALILCTLGLLVLAGIGLRSRLRPAGTVDAAGGAEAEHPPADEMRVARWLFYAGCVLIGEQSLRKGGLTVSEMLFFASLAACLLSLLRGGRLVAPPSAVIIAVGVFAFGGAISSLGAASPPRSAYGVAHAIYVLGIWPALAATVLRERSQIMVAVSLWALSAAVDGGGAIAQTMGLHLPGVAQQGNRMTGLTENPNDLAGVTAIALVPALMCAIRPRIPAPAGAAALPLAPLVPLGRWAVVALIAIGILLSGSVSGMVAAALAVMVWLSAPAARAPTRFAIAAAIACALAVMAVAGGRVSTPVSRLSQIANPVSSNGGSVQDRLAIVQQAWPRIRSDPLIGAGLDIRDSGVSIISHGNTASYQLHGLPLAAWYQTGLFGLAGLLGLLGVLAVCGWSSVSQAADEGQLLGGLALLAAFVAMAVFAMVQPMAFQQYSWISPALLIAWRLRADIDTSVRRLTWEPAHPALGPNTFSSPLAGGLRVNGFHE